jgi:hypothetical protein
MLTAADLMTDIIQRKTQLNADKGKEPKGKDAANKSLDVRAEQLLIKAIFGANPSPEALNFCINSSRSQKKCSSVRRQRSKITVNQSRGMR